MTDMPHQGIGYQASATHYRVSTPAAVANLLVGGTTILAGLYLAISPWVVNSFVDGAERLAMINIILGLAIAVYGLALSTVPAEASRAGWALLAIGVWEFLTPWVIGPHTGATLWNNIVMGIVIGVLGVDAIGMYARKAMTGGSNSGAGSGTIR
ncbi:SPW repeat protein [Nocardia sp. CDC159]|uniref:SPW repeat protein n=1 Tax=Nocardia pulmonis TaxID=2951408 RepID=A0A9X2EDN6_9NOCA|nr:MULTISPECIES: SPW repeat protein [Nocardia]MCM6778964.1 SPW repeat protein [Nocardia pulmonis]MCM6791853.1 SPW repeat protein [Nocardia sp. CDC159]